MKFSKYTAAWLVWIAAFFVIEGLAIVDSGPNDTLSEHAWWLFGLAPVLWATGLGAGIWLLIHLFSGRWSYRVWKRWFTRGG